MYKEYQNIDQIKETNRIVQIIIHKLVYVLTEGQGINNYDLKDIEHLISKIHIMKLKYKERN